MRLTFTFRSSLRAALALALCAALATLIDLPALAAWTVIGALSVAAAVLVARWAQDVAGELRAALTQRRARQRRAPRDLLP